MRRRTLLRLTAAGLAGLAVAAWLRWTAPSPPAAGVTRENFERLRVGMTEAEVAAEFGCPAGDYSRHGYTVGGPGVRRWWVTDEALVTVLLEPEDPRDPDSTLRASWMAFEPLPPETFWQRCRWFFR